MDIDNEAEAKEVSQVVDNAETKEDDKMEIDQAEDQEEGRAEQKESYLNIAKKKK